MHEKYNIFFVNLPQMDFTIHVDCLLTAALLLITAVLTVPLPVTHLDLLYALAAATRGLCGITLRVVCYTIHMVTSFQLDLF